jgi:hypothetical protein
MAGAASSWSAATTVDIVQIYPEKILFEVKVYEKSMQAIIIRTISQK